MAPKKPTIYDVAEISGVSISTISRVLNSPEKVNSKTRERVMSAIDQLGFVPRAEARARARRSTNRIGVLTLCKNRYVEWESVPVEGDPFTERGEGGCHP